MKCTVNARIGSPEAKQLSHIRRDEIEAALADAADEQRVVIGAVEPYNVKNGFSFGGIDHLSNAQNGSSARIPSNSATLASAAVASISSSA